MEMREATRGYEEKGGWEGEEERELVPSIFQNVVAPLTTGLCIACKTERHFRML